MSVTGFNRRRRELAELERQSETRPSEGQEVKEEPTFADLRNEAREAGIEGYGKMKKVELEEVLGK